MMVMVTQKKQNPESLFDKKQFPDAKIVAFLDQTGHNFKK